MAKRKNINKSSDSNKLGIAVSIILIIFTSTVIYKFISNDNLAISSDQVWCSNCQKYHDRETAEQEQAKLVWCINCQKYHAPGLDENK